MIVQFLCDHIIGVSGISIFGVVCAFFSVGFVSFAIVSLSIIWYFVCPYLFCFLIMAIERDDSLQSVSVRLDEKNYLYWSYVMRNFLKGKKNGDMLLELV